MTLVFLHVFQMYIFICHGIIIINNKIYFQMNFFI